MIKTVRGLDIKSGTGVNNSEPTFCYGLHGLYWENIKTNGVGTYTDKRPLLPRKQIEDRFTVKAIANLNSLVKE